MRQGKNKQYCLVFNSTYFCLIMQPLFYSNNSAFLTLPEPTTFLSNQARILTSFHDNLLFSYSSMQFQVSKSFLCNQLYLQAFLQPKLSEIYHSPNIKSRQHSVASNSQKESSMERSGQAKVQTKNIQKTEKQIQKLDGDSQISRLRKKKKINYFCGDSDDGSSKLSRKSSETKNMVKNFANLIFNFVSQSPKSSHLIEKLGGGKQILDFVIEIYGKIQSIEDLRGLWIDEKHAKLFRTVCEHFLRKKYFSHVFNSRILNHKNHLKLRKKLLESLKNPQNFRNLKDF